MKRSRVAGVAALLVIGVPGVLALLVWITARSSLPALNGTVRLQGLSSVTRIARDPLGIPTITAATRNDLARGLGYVHGQDRFFQMDLQRRAAAGELSALLGPSVLQIDRELRVHRFRQVARAVVAHLEPGQRALLEAYVAGVNAGLASLSSRPAEYWLLRSKPAPWSAEDSMLCVYTMYLQLQDAIGHVQLQRALLRATLPEGAWRFLLAAASDWDGAVDGSVADAPRMPLPADFDLHDRRDLLVTPPTEVLRHISLLGSNNWAVSGAHTANGSALIANDMHLGFRVPIIWYRARLVQEGDPTSALDVSGASLPGTPSVVVGSNGHIAWGFTASYAQFSTLIRLIPAPGAEPAYLTADGAHPLRVLDESIEVAGGATDHLKIQMTEWGPVVGTDWEGKPYALQWTAHDPDATNLNLLRLERARSVAEVIAPAAGLGVPGLNLVVADADGHIGWTIAGELPERIADTVLSTEPRLLAAPRSIAPERQPHIVDPPSGYVWTANARVVGGADAALLGDDDMYRGARAQQIRDDLSNSPAPFTPARSLAIELDDRAVFLARWKDLLGTVIEHSVATGHAEDAARATLAAWSGHARPDDPAYRLVNFFRQQVEARAYYMLIAPARARAPDFKFVIPSSFEGALWILVEQRPAHLLAPRYADWDQFFAEALAASEELPDGCHSLPTCPWGVVNSVRIVHPLSSAIPGLGLLLDMPVVRIPGAREDMPRIQGNDYGSSERFSVSPGHEPEGYFNMPGAQSGQVFSPYYRAGFADWVDAKPTPFLPGPAQHTMVLEP